MFILPVSCVLSSRLNPWLKLTVFARVIAFWREQFV